MDKHSIRTKGLNKIISYLEANTPSESKFDYKINRIGDLSKVDGKKVESYPSTKFLTALKRELNDIEEQGRFQEILENALTNTLIYLTYLQDKDVKEDFVDRLSESYLSRHISDEFLDEVSEWQTEKIPVEAKGVIDYEDVSVRIFRDDKEIYKGDFSHKLVRIDRFDLEVEFIYKNQIKTVKLDKNTSEIDVQFDLPDKLGNETESKPDSNTYVCDNCGREFEKEGTIKAHEKTCGNNQENNVSTRSKNANESNSNSEKDENSSRKRGRSEKNGYAAKIAEEFYNILQKLFSLGIGLIKFPFVLVRKVLGFLYDDNVIAIIAILVFLGWVVTDDISYSSESGINYNISPEVKDSIQNEDYDPSKVKELVHEKINIERSERGLSNLSYSNDLEEIADYHSTDMAQKGYFSHDSPSGESRSDRYEKYNYDCRIRLGSIYYTGGENIGTSYYDISVDVSYEDSVFVDTNDELAETIVQGWMHSEGHRKNILKPYWEREGIGLAARQTEDGKKIYATQNFC
jgi:uncharacterized protein YkwD